MVEKIVILYSSGLDSFIMEKLARKTYPDAEIICIYYKHGAPSEEQELKLLPEHVEVRTIDWLNEKKTPVSKKSNPLVGPIYIPGRNMIFANLAACQELPDEIWLGPLIDECNDLATDKNEEFRFRCNRLMQYVLSPFKEDIKLVYPFVERGWTKIDCVNWALDNGVSVEEILSTVSCSFHDGVSACGECFQCLKRRMVMLNCGIDAVESYTDPMENEFGKGIITGIKNEVDAGNDDPDTINMHRMYLVARGRLDENWVN